MVIVIIGILATITMVSFTGISKQANIASIKSDLSNASLKLKLFQADKGFYPLNIDCRITPDVDTICLKFSPGNDSFNYQPDSGSSPQNFSLSVSNSSVSINYRITNNLAPIEVLPSVVATGGTITNVGSNRVHTFTTGGTFTVTSGGYVDISILGAGGGAGGPVFEDICGAYGNGSPGGLTKVSKSGVDWQANGGGGGAGTDMGYCGGSGTGINGALGTTNSPSGWTATNGGGSLGGSKYGWSGYAWEAYGGNGGAGGKLEKTNLSVATGDVYTITIGAMGQTNGSAGKVIITYSI